MPPVSPLAPISTPALPPIAGVRVGSIAAEIRYRGRPDLFMAELAPGTTVAGCLTRSLTASAPVEWCRAGLRGGVARAVIANAGNANAFTGQAGISTVEATAGAAATLVGGEPGQVFLASTGVIGEPLPPEKITRHLEALHASLDPGRWDDAARAIMTTDTFMKVATRRTQVADVPVTINGIAKGSGMIAPDMATMLVFLFTDAAIAAPALQALLAGACERSFNCITVDSDTSTSDTLLLFATGGAGHAPIDRPSDPRLSGFRRELDGICRDLALQVVRDGEGASKLVEIRVTGAASGRAAKRIGLAVANSPLVKTAIAGEDANWGRIVMAVGKSGERADRDRLRIAIGGVEVTRDGMVVPGYDEAPVTRHMKGQEILIEVDVGIGRGKATVWTCDLTHGYIDINGSYRS